MKNNSQSRDMALVSDEPYEIEYIHQQFPKSSHQEVHNAVNECKSELNGSEDRDRIMSCLRKKLKG